MAGRRRVQFKKTGSRSSFEMKIKDDLTERGIPFEYETVKLSYTKITCPHCEGVADKGVYTPDFIIPKTKQSRLIVEGKGYFDAPNRTLMLRVKRDNPLEDIRFLFYRNSLIGKKSKTTYGMWCDKHGFPWAVGTSVPESWIIG